MRESGFYRVRYNGEWTIAKWYEPFNNESGDEAGHHVDGWWSDIIGANKDIFNDSDIEQIDENRIEMPE